jgi:hypothetical protein
VDGTVPTHRLETRKARVIHTVAEYQPSSSVQKLRIAGEWQIFVVVCASGDQSLSGFSNAGQYPWLALVITIGAWGEADL